jgi:hypothetical protein
MAVTRSPDSADHGSVHDPDLLIAYLRYAVEEVRDLSERSADLLEAAIITLSQDTSIVAVTKEEAH